LKNLRMLMIKPCGRDEAHIVHTLTQSAFKHYLGLLDPPSGVVRESAYLVRHDLEAHGGAIAWMGVVPVGCLRLEVESDHLHVRRVAVPPEYQRKGIGIALMEWAHGHARTLGLREVRLGVRLQLSGNQAFYRHLGYKVVASHRHPAQRGVTWYDMVRTV